MAYSVLRRRRGAAGLRCLRLRGELLAREAGRHLVVDRDHRLVGELVPHRVAVLELAPFVARDDAVVELDAEPLLHRLEVAAGERLDVTKSAVCVAKLFCVSRSRPIDCCQIVNHGIIVMFERQHHLLDAGAPRSCSSSCAGS
jgi:antitoxin (DNA-binding transcriptional repressor) of toxin-antitoxin stability system